MSKDSAADEEMIRRIIIERIKAMSPNVKIALGSSGGFLSREELLKEINDDSAIGRKIIQMQLKYLKALKEGIPVE